MDDQTDSRYAMHEAAREGRSKNPRIYLLYQLIQRLLLNNQLHSQRGGIAAERLYPLPSSPLLGQCARLGILTRTVSSRRIPV